MAGNGMRNLSQIEAEGAPKAVTVTLDHDEFIAVCMALTQLGPQNAKIGFARTAFGKLIRAAQVANGVSA